jgi:hypothetical protein
LRIAPDGALHATRAKQTVLKAPASAQAEWPALFGPQLAGALSQFADSAKETGKAVSVPVDEL